jgi:hypothetical protein
VTGQAQLGSVQGLWRGTARAPRGIQHVARQGVVSDTWPDLSTPRASAESMSVTQDEDRNPRRGGSLERDQPTSPPIETLKRPSTACSHAEEKRTRGDEASAPSRRGGGNPWRAENPRRGSAPIVRGNTRRPEYGLPIRVEP